MSVMCICLSGKNNTLFKSDVTNYNVLVIRNTTRRTSMYFVEKENWNGRVSKRRRVRKGRSKKKRNRAKILRFVDITKRGNTESEKILLAIECREKKAKKKEKNTKFTVCIRLDWVLCCFIYRMFEYAFEFNSIKNQRVSFLVDIIDIKKNKNRYINIDLEKRLFFFLLFQTK